MLRASSGADYLEVIDPYGLAGGALCAVGGGVGSGAATGSAAGGFALLGSAALLWSRRRRRRGTEAHSR